MIKTFTNLRDALVFCQCDDADLNVGLIELMGTMTINQKDKQIMVCDMRGLNGYEVNWMLALYKGENGVLTARCNVKR